MTAALLVGLAVWTAAAVTLALLTGRGIRIADQRESRPPC